MLDFAMQRGRRRTIAASIAVLACAALSRAQSTPEVTRDIKPLAKQIAAMVAEPAVSRAHWGVMVTAMDGTTIYALNEAEFFQPASNTKLFTTAAALHLLGGDRRFTTLLQGPSGFTQSHTLAGNLVLHGDGDANLSARTVPYTPPSERTLPAAEPLETPGDALRYLRAMADEVVSAGITHIAGNVIGDDTLFAREPYPEDWAVDDLVWGYGAPVSALSVNDNQLLLTVTPGARPGDKATISLDPAVPYYTLNASVLTTAPGGESSVQVRREPGSRALDVFGTIAAGSPKDTQEVAILDPAEYAALALKSLLEERGVIVDGTALARHRPSHETRSLRTQGNQPLPSLSPASANHAAGFDSAPCRGDCPLHVEHQSPTVLNDVVITNKVSQNLHAELLLRHLGRKFGEDGTAAQGARVVRQFLAQAGIDKEDFVFFDGSGLSGHDLVTPRAVARLLYFAANQPWAAEFKASLPIGGVDGGLLHRFTSPAMKGHVFAKTGTLGEARALSGYMECTSGRTLIFSVMVTDHAPGTSADREVLDRIVTAIAANN